MPARQTTARRRPARARRSSVRWPPRGLPRLEQRHLDLIGLGLVAVAVFLAFLIYLDWDGGTAGEGAVEGLRWLVGAAHYLVPPALMAAGAVLVLRPVLPAIRPFRAGGLCLFAALSLALAAGTLGLGPFGERVRFWDPAFVKPRGGMGGEGLYWATSSLVGHGGAHIAARFLFLSLAAVLLLTGASVAGVLKATGDSVTSTGRLLRDGTATRVARRRADEDLAALEAGWSDGETAVMAKRDFWSGDERFPDLYDEAPPEPEPEPEEEPPAAHPEPAEPRLAEDPETDEPGVTRAPAGDVAEDEPDGEASRLAGEPRPTPQGRSGREVPASPDFVWTVPDGRFLKRSSAESARPDTAGQERVSAQLIEALGHFGVEARVIGMVAGPHITRYELRLAPGIKVAKVAQL